MRVAFDLTVPAQAATGSAVYARQLLQGLQRGSLDIVPWQRPFGPAMRFANALRLTAWLQREVSKRIRREGVAVYHSACSVGPLRVPCPAVMTVHDATGVTTGSAGGAGYRLWFRVFGVQAARRAAAVIVPSFAARDAVARAYGIGVERLHVTPYGVSAQFRPVPGRGQAPVLSRHGVRPPYFLFVGSHLPHKNLLRLLRAFAQLSPRASSRPVQLVLVGPSVSRNTGIDQLVARLSLGERVRQTGWVPDDQLPALYSGAAGLVYPSLSEGFGLPILEAMACGTPVLTSGGSSMAEVAGDAAVLVDPLRVDSIADGLSRLVDDRELSRALIARGCDRVREFTWERTAEATERVYRLVEAGARRAGPV